MQLSDGHPDRFAWKRKNGCHGDVQTHQETKFIEEESIVC